MDCSDYHRTGVICTAFDMLQGAVKRLPKPSQCTDDRLRETVDTLQSIAALIETLLVVEVGDE